MPTTDTWSSIAGSTTPLSWSGRTRNWTVTPNFGALPKDEKPVNAYVDEHFEATATADYISNTAPDGTVTVVHNDLHTDSGAGLMSSMISYFGSQTNWESEQSSLDNACIVEALVKMADAKVNIPVALAEAHKTSDLILDTARRIDRAYRAFRRGDLRGIASNLNISPKRLHKSWLEYKYGWMPLLMDVKGSAEFFAQQNVGRPVRFTVTRRKTLSKSYVWTPSSPAYSGISPPVTLTIALNGQRSNRVTFWCELSNPHWAELQQVGLTNPALVAWELIPYSFVFDWFIQVGDWLTALTAQNGVTIRRQLFSAATVMTMDYSRPSTSRSSGGWTYYQRSNHYTAKRRTYGRTSTVSTGTIVPTMKANFGFQKLVTSLALIRGSYRGNARV